MTDEFDNAVTASLNQTATNARMGFSAAVDTNPDAYAEDMRIARRTGLPVPTVANLPQEARRQDAMGSIDFDTLARQSPSTAALLIDPDKAKLAHDDIQNLADTESTIGAIRGPKPSFMSVASGLLNSLPQGAEMARQGIRLQMADLFGFDAVRKDAQERYSRASLENADSTPGFQSSTAQGVYGGLASTVRMIPGLAASIATRSAAPMLATMGVQTEAEAYGKYRARGASGGEALAGAAGEGITEVATEMLPMGFLVKNLGKMNAGHFLTGLLAREIPSEQIATLVQDAIDTAVANPDKTWGQFMAERPDAAYQTLVATVTQAAVMGGVNAAAGKVQGRSQEAEHANGIGEVLQQMNTLATASKVRERDTATSQAFFQSLTEEGRDSVWITPQALAESGMAEQIAQLIPGVAEQLQGAQDTGAEIRIPIADLMANMAGPELAQAIIPHLADEPGGFTATTAAEYMQSGAAQELQAEVGRAVDAKQESDVFNASRDAVTAQVAEQLKTAGRFTDDVNGAYASMVGNFYAVQAAKLGVTPEALAARYPVQVRAEALPGARTLDQGPTLASVEDAWAAAGIKNFISENDDRITLSQIIVPDDERGAGKGTAAMQALVDYADAAGKHVVLSPSAAFGGNKKRLTGFYKRFGFVENKGKNRAFTTMESMYRTAPGKVLHQPARGSMSVSDDITQNPTVITLLQKADLSTALHEFGHFFLEVQNDIASRADAPDSIKADMNATLAWFGVADLATWNGYDLEQKRPFHEQFARGFEAYLFEGNAPNPELQGVFSRFRAWMLHVYKSLTALNVELTDEVRGVFDRMLASTEAIQEAEHEAGFGGLFATKPAFMTDDEWVAYQLLALDATQDAVRDLETRSLRDMQWLTNAKSRLLGKLQRDAADKRKAIRKEVKAEVMAEPVNQAKTFFKRGMNPDGTKTEGPHKLAIDGLTELYGGEGDRFAMLNWEPLGYGQYGMLAKEGLSPDAAAEIFGFGSGDEMARALLGAEDAATKIEGMTDLRMLERYGDLSDEQSIKKALDAALHADARTRFVATELNALNKAAGNRPVLAKAAKAYAEAAIARLKISALRPDLYTAAAKRAAKASEKAFGKGDLRAAAVEKQNQLVNTYAAKAAMDARTEMEKTLSRFKLIANGKDDAVGKTRDMDMVHATRAILAEFGIGNKGPKATEYMKSVEAYDPGMAAVLLDRIAAATAIAAPFRDLTIEQARALRDEVESLWHQARRMQQMEVDGDLLDRQVIQDELRARLEEIGIPDTVPGEGKAITEGETSLSRLQSLRAALRRVEAWTSARDGAAAMGPFRKFIWNTIKDPADAYRADKAKFLKQYRQLLDPIAKSLTRAKIAAPEIGYTFGHDKGGMGKVELLHAILHTGNEGNKRKLLLGRRWATEKEDGTLDTGRWDGFVQRMVDEGRLTKADFDFAQGVWGLLEDMKPMAQKAHRDVFGRYFDEVTATPFQVSLPTTTGARQLVSYAGGYVPAMADSRIVSDAKTRALAEEENSTLQMAFPATSKGFTKGRVDYNKPLLLDLRAISQHIDKVLLFSHLEQPIRDVRRVLASKPVAYALNRIDPSAFDGLLTPWLNRTARQQVETPIAGANGLTRFFAVARARAGMAAMFANVSNTVQQITGFSTALLKVQPKYLMAGAVDYLRSPAEMTAFVAEASPYMRMRLENEVQALSGIINDILLNPSVYEKAQAWSSKHAYFLQSAVDSVMSPIIWHGAYNQALESAPVGMTDEQMTLYARRLADSAVRETQGSTLPEDISRIETGNAFARMFTQFYGYFNMVANANATELIRISDDVGLRKGAGRGLYVLMFGFLAPAWVASAIALAFRGGPEDEDKDGSYLDDWMAQTFGWGLLRNMTAMIPVAGQVANAAANTLNSKPYDDKISTSPAISMIESTVSAPKSVYKAVTGDGGQGKAIRDVATLVSMATGIPALGMVKPIIYGADVATGRTRPLGPVDAARGVISGISSPESKGR